MRKKLILVQFTGRLNGAIGLAYQQYKTVSVLASLQGTRLTMAARLAIYDTHEHVSGLSIITKEGVNHD